MHMHSICTQHTHRTCPAYTPPMPASCPPQARVLFEPLLRRGEASLWLELASLEAPNAERQRAVYRRGTSEVHTLAQARPLQAAWLSFEALHGSVVQQRQAELRCAERLADALAREPPPLPPVAAHGAEGAEGAAAAAAAEAAATREREHRRTQARKAKRRETHVAVPGGDEAQLRLAEIASHGEIASGQAEAEAEQPPAKKQNRGPPKPGPPPAAAPTAPKPAGPAAAPAATAPAAAATAPAAATATATAAAKKPSLLPRGLMAPRAVQTKAGRAKPVGKPTPGTKPVVRVKLPPPAAAPQPGAPEPKTNQQLRDLLLPK